MHEYDLIADWYATQRNPEIGIPEVNALAGSLRPGARVLDIGCGSGIPLTRALVETGCEVFAIDSSEEMVLRFRRNLPAVPVECAPVQVCDFQGRTFDAIHAWGVIFHLTHADQAFAFARIAGVLKPGGCLLFTAGDVDGSTDGEMNGVTFRYFSFTVDGYRSILEEQGLTVIDVHKDSGSNCYYLARKR